MTRKMTSTSVAIQNIMILIKDVKEPGAAISSAIKKARDKWLNIYEIYLAISTGNGLFRWAGCF